MPGYFEKRFLDSNIGGLLERCFTAIESTPSLSAAFLPKSRGGGRSYQEQRENQPE